MAPATCVPMKELKNTAEFTETVQNAAGPVLVTKNGREAFVALSMSGYEALCAEAARAKLYQAIDRAEADIDAGRVTDAREVSAGLRAKYGL